MRPPLLLVVVALFGCDTTIDPAPLNRPSRVNRLSAANITSETSERHMKNTVNARPTSKATAAMATLSPGCARIRAGMVAMRHRALPSIAMPTAATASPTEAITRIARRSAAFASRNARRMETRTALKGTLATSRPLVHH